MCCSSLLCAFTLEMLGRGVGDFFTRDIGLHLLKGTFILMLCIAEKKQVLCSGTTMVYAAFEKGIDGRYIQRMSGP